MANLEARIRMAAESILDNEALRSDLNDDEAARSLLDWGIAWATTLAQQTASIEDDDEADEAVYPRMKALRSLMTALKDLSLAEGWTHDTIHQTLETAIGSARILYGPTWQPPQDLEQKIGLILRTDSPGARLNALLGWMSSQPVPESPTAAEPTAGDGKSQKSEGFFARFFRRLRGD